MYVILQRPASRDLSAFAADIGKVHAPKAELDWSLSFIPHSWIERIHCGAPSIGLADPGHHNRIESRNS